MANTDALMTSKSYEWYTPPHIIAAVRECLGDIELDPCSYGPANRVVGARRFFDKRVDAFSGVSWECETLFLNPPYGSEIGRWVRTFYSASEVHGFRGILLVPARTDTKWFRWLHGVPICFVRGRLKFWTTGGGGYPATFPSAISCVNVDTDKFAKAFKDIGDVFVRHT